MKKIKILIALCVLVLTMFTERNCMADMFFLSPKYQNEIVIETLLLNKADVSRLFRVQNDKGLSHSQIFNNDVNLIVRLKNVGNKAAWGTLTCKIIGYGDVQVFVPHLKPNMKEFVDFVIPLSGMVPPRSMDSSPTIEIKWEKLNSK